MKNFLRRIFNLPATSYHRAPAIVTEAQQKNANEQRLMVLAGTSPEHPVWKAVLSYADEHARNESLFALSPGLSDSARQYNAGRAAAAEDFALALRNLRLHAEAYARKKTLKH